jgi:transaldolase
MNALQQLSASGQSIWLDFITRTMLRDGSLARMIREDALTGMTSNPTIFEKALAEGTAYDEQIRGAGGSLSAWELFELVETDDVRTACDAFRGVFTRTRGCDGFVSIEVSPGPAHDADATVEEAHRLWKTVGRPNLMIKVPGTVEGAKAVRRLIADGINVNITLLFSLEAYASVIDAYLGGLEERVAAGQEIAAVRSVASFFVSRVDTEVDKRLDAKIAAAGSDAERARLRALKGKAAVANAKLAYELFQREFSSPRWRAMDAMGGEFQRPLWASTGTKNPEYSDVKYVEELIGPNTVNTIPPATLEAFRDHGKVERQVDRGVEDARRTIADLEAAGISLKDVTDKLLTEGLKSFQKSFDTLIAGLEAKSAKLGRELAKA